MSMYSWLWRVTLEIVAPVELDRLDPCDRGDPAGAPDLDVDRPYRRRALRDSNLNAIAHRGW